MSLTNGKGGREREWEREVVRREGGRGGRGREGDSIWIEKDGNMRKPKTRRPMGWTLL